jgi:7-cyano-7-deazaguanine synthase
MDKKDAIVVFSGGQDSTTLMFWAREQFMNVTGVSFAYGQRHSDEIRCAADICEKHGFAHHVFDMSLLGALAPNSLTRGDMDVQKEAVEGEVPNTVVDGRNMLFITFAAVFAKQMGVEDIVVGVSQSDFSGYPDCRDVFIKSLNVTLNLSMDYGFRIHTPLMWLDKKMTWKLADDLGVMDVIKDETLTCYNGIRGRGCMECPACFLRNRGLEQYEEEKKNGKL